MRWLAFPRATLAALALAAALSLPALSLGLFLDDYIHLASATGLESPAKGLELYRFASGNPSELARFIERGPYPWWTLRELKLNFWRPFSSALTYVDLALFGKLEWPPHLHSALWYLALVGACALVLRRALPSALGGAALLLFAIDDAHWMPVSWLANRNALVAATPALLGLVAHLRWREERWRFGLPLSMLGYTLGLLAGEAALGVFCYLAAYEWVAAPGGRRERLGALLPAGLLGLAYVVVYKLGNYGAFGSGIYIDPSATPGAFLVALPPRLLAMVAAQLVAFPADFWLYFEHLRPVQVSLGALALVGSGWLLRRAIRGLAEVERRGLTWLLAGAGLSLLPVAATFPTNRLLLLPSLGGSALLAVLIRHAWRASPFERAWAVVLVLLHVPLAVLGWGSQYAAFGSAGPRVEKTLVVPLDPSLHVVIPLAPDPSVALYAPVVRSYRGAPQPRSWWTLSLAPFDHLLTRTAEDALELEVVGGHMLSTVFEQMVRAPQFPLREGDQVTLRGFTATVREASSQGPRRLAFRFDRPLDDPSLLFLEWKEGALRPLELPKVGESRRLARELGPLGF
ncbi:MAG: hypothetical protein ACOZIN_12615 [Myxococcota bacterium]